MIPSTSVHSSQIRGESHWRNVPSFLKKGNEKGSTWAPDFIILCYTKRRGTYNLNPIPFDIFFFFHWGNRNLLFPKERYTKGRGGKASTPQRQ